MPKVAEPAPAAANTDELEKFFESKDVRAYVTRWHTREDAWLGTLRLKSGVSISLLELAPRNPFLRMLGFDVDGVRVVMVTIQNPTEHPLSLDPRAPSFLLTDGRTIAAPPWEAVHEQVTNAFEDSGDKMASYALPVTLLERPVPITIQPGAQSKLVFLFAPANFDFRPLQSITLQIDGAPVVVPGHFRPAAELAVAPQLIMPDAVPTPAPAASTPPKLPADRVRIEPQSGLEFVSLPGGTFHFGCASGDAQCEPDEKPGRDVKVKPFRMGRTEVTAGAYAKCVKAGACSADVTTVNNYSLSVREWREASRRCSYGVSELENFPMNCVSWSQAQAFCRWIGGRLPTAEEWEYAAKGGEDRIYPWGNEPFSGERANFCDSACIERRAFFEHPSSSAAAPSFAGAEHDGWRDPAPVGRFPQGATRDGLLDMAGNLIEMTGSDYNQDLKESRGGWFAGGDTTGLRVSRRGQLPPRLRAVPIGFRCAL